MNKQEARIAAMRHIAGNIRTTIEGGCEPTNNEEDDERVFREMHDIADEIDRRADAIEARMLSKRGG